MRVAADASPAAFTFVFAVVWRKRCRIAHNLVACGMERARRLADVISRSAHLHKSVDRGDFVGQHIFSILRRQTRSERVSECVVTANWERKSLKSLDSMEIDAEL